MVLHISLERSLGVLTLKTTISETGGPDWKSTQARFQRAGGEKMVIDVLKRIEADGAWELLLKRQIPSHGTSERFAPRRTDEYGNIIIRVRPAGGDTCLECYLRPPKTMRRNLAETFDSMLDLFNDKEEIQTAAAVVVIKEVLTGSKEGINGAELTTKPVTTPESTPVPKLPPAPDPKPANDHDPAVSLMQSGRDVAGLVNAANKLREIRGQRSGLMEKRLALDEQISALIKQEKELVLALDAAPLYAAIQVIETAQAEAKDPK